VELGKELATSLGLLISGDAPADDKDGSTQALLGYVKRYS
jgi:glucose-6-phosphate isomerase